MEVLMLITVVGLEVNLHRAATNGLVNAKVK